MFAAFSLNYFLLKNFARSQICLQSSFQFNFFP